MDDDDDLKKRLTINHDRMDLARLIKQDSVKAIDLKVGDVIVDCHNIWQVDSKTVNNNGKNVLVRDADENGINHFAETAVKILRRTSLVKNYKGKNFYGD